MAVAVVRVGDVRVRVGHGVVPVQVRVRLDHRALVRVRVVLVVDVQVLVLDSLVRVPVRVPRAPPLARASRSRAVAHGRGARVHA